MRVSELGDIPAILGVGYYIWIGGLSKYACSTLIPLIYFSPFSLKQILAARPLLSRPEFAGVFLRDLTNP